MHLRFVKNIRMLFVTNNEDLNFVVFNGVKILFLYLIKLR